MADPPPAYTSTYPNHIHSDHMSQLAPGQSQPASRQSQPALGQPQPASGQPQPASGQPQPAPGKPQPASGQPLPASGQSQPESGQPNAQPQSNFLREPSTQPLPITRHRRTAFAQVSRLLGLMFGSPVNPVDVFSWVVVIPVISVILTLAVLDAKTDVIRLPSFVRLVGRGISVGFMELVSTFIVVVVFLSVYYLTSLESGQNVLSSFRSFVSPLTLRIVTVTIAYVVSVAIFGHC
ncbi:hypothetical protein BDY21DRAFT_38266 [Lineolata rhizophorae]|uniref:Uncharacterized protein n=1 Tax=Lineolata rhizophorae TaxID=578093 RepID=A0A6A6P1E9_9PEZI|nr:hypothetical protein BDY21DRAFT_38266 [Lineolata rhizophorae]